MFTKKTFIADSGPEVTKNRLANMGYVVEECLQQQDSTQVFRIDTFRTHSDVKMIEITNKGVIATLVCGTRHSLKSMSDLDKFVYDRIPVSI